MEARLSEAYRSLETTINRSVIKVFGIKGLIILGCGRSGTTYTSKKLKSLGLKVGHERLKQNGICSWYLVAENSHVPFGPSFSDLIDLNFPVVHQVREPVATISSILSIGKPSWAFIENEIPIDSSRDSLLTMAMKYYYHWNLLAEKKASFRFKVEEIDTLIGFLKKRGFPLSYGKVNSSVSKRENTRKHPILNWDDLRNENVRLSKNIENLAGKYGY